MKGMFQRNTYHRYLIGHVQTILWVIPPASSRLPYPPALIAHPGHTKNSRPTTCGRCRCFDVSLCIFFGSASKSNPLQPPLMPLRPFEFDAGSMPKSNMQRLAWHQCWSARAMFRGQGGQPKTQQNTRPPYMWPLQEFFAGPGRVIACVIYMSGEGGQRSWKNDVEF